MLTVELLLVALRNHCKYHPRRTPPPFPNLKHMHKQQSYVLNHMPYGYTSNSQSEQLCINSHLHHTHLPYRTKTCIGINVCKIFDCQNREGLHPLKVNLQNVYFAWKQLKTRKILFWASNNQIRAMMRGKIYSRHLAKLCSVEPENFLYMGYMKLPLPICWTICLQ